MEANQKVSTRVGASENDWMEAAAISSQQKNYYKAVIASSDALITDVDNAAVLSTSLPWGSNLKFSFALLPFILGFDFSLSMMSLILLADTLLLMGVWRVVAWVLKNSSLRLRHFFFRISKTYGECNSN